VRGRNDRLDRDRITGGNAFDESSASNDAVWNRQAGAKGSAKTDRLATECGFLGGFDERH